MEILPVVANGQAGVVCQYWQICSIFAGLGYNPPRTRQKASNFDAEQIFGFDTRLHLVIDRNRPFVLYYVHAESDRSNRK